MTTVDAEYVRPGFAAVHLLERAGRVAIVDAGANSSVPLVLQALRAFGVDVQAVDWLFLTHVHLDHAGGAGQLLSHLPNAQVAVHPKGASHVVEPSRLQAATSAVYGQKSFERLYGALVPIPQNRVHETHDGERIRLGTSELVIVHTPGHALHHQVLFCPASRSVFTGDTFGLSYRELDTQAGAFVVPTTTPSQFDPAQLIASLERIAGLEPECAYLTHYGRITNVDRVAADLREQVHAFVDIANRCAALDEPALAIRSRLHSFLVGRAERHGIEQAPQVVEQVLGPDLDLNAKGLVAWLSRSRKHNG